jgi:tetratricopeptide (TPR) repeat protein
VDFYNPNEKIRLLRKQLGINQSLLEDINMTRAFISMMESGKRRISRKSSQILASKFNSIAKERAININLDNEYFYRRPEEDARYYCNNELSKKEIRHKELEEIIDVAKRYQLSDMLINAYKANGEIYFIEADYMKAFTNFSNSLGKCKEINENSLQPYIYNAMGVCKIRRNEDEEAVFYFSQALWYSKEQNNDLYFIKASYNLALGYSKTKEYEKCLEVIEKNILRNDISEENEDLLKARVLKANTYLRIGKNEEVLYEYLKIIDSLKEDDIDTLSMIYNNIAEYHYKKEQFEESLNYINKAQKLRNRESISVVLDTKGKIFLKQGLYNEGIMIFELAISFAEEYKQFTVLVEIYKNLIKTYELMDDLHKIKESAQTLLETLDKNCIDNGRSYALYKLIEINTTEGNIEESLSLLHKLRPMLIEE